MGCGGVWGVVRWRVGCGGLGGGAVGRRWWGSGAVQALDALHQRQVAVGHALEVAACERPAPVVVVGAVPQQLVEASSAFGGRARRVFWRSRAPCVLYTQVT